MPLWHLWRIVFNPNHIDILIRLQEFGENKQSQDYWKNDRSIKMRLVSAKVLVDRWDMISTDVILHPDHKGLIEETFGFDLVHGTLWGMNIHYSVEMPKDKGMILSLDFFKKDPTNTKAVAVFPINIDCKNKPNNESKSLKIDEDKELAKCRNFYSSLIKLLSENKDNNKKYVYISFVDFVNLLMADNNNLFELSKLKEDLQRLRYGKILGYELMVTKRITPGSCFLSENELTILQVGDTKKENESNIVRLFE